MIKIISLIIILFLAAFLRLYQLPDLARFGYDEARDAQIVRDMVTNRNLTLLGPETVIGDKTIYFGPLHYYLITPSLVIGHFDPMYAYYFTAILGVITTLAIFYLTKSYIAAAFYAVFPIAVFYNRWPWNPNTIPLFATLSLIALFKKKYLLTGIFLGLTIQLHFTAAVLLVFSLIYMFIKKANRKSFVFIILGCLIGILPIILFDLKNEFLYTKSVLSLINANWSYRGFNWHYFLWLLPLLALLIAKLPKKIGTAIASISLTASLYLLLMAKPDSVLNPTQVKLVSEIIANDQKNINLPFNIASFVDADARATSYRYFVRGYGQNPLGVAEYSVADHLYVVAFAPPGEILYNKTYEISSFAPKKVAKVWKLRNKYIYRLEK